MIRTTEEIKRLVADVIKLNTPDEKLKENNMDFDKLEKMLGTSSNIAQKNEIEIGDTVCVNFHVARYTLCNKAEVLYVPQSSGDAWHFRDIETKELHEVSEGCTITLIKSI